MKHERGFSIVESLIAMSLVGMVAISITAGLMVMVESNTRNGERSGAISAAESELEELRIQDPELMAVTGSTTPKLVTVGDRNYEVVTHYCETSDLCFDATRQLRVEVRHNGSAIYDVTTVFTQLR